VLLLLATLAPAACTTTYRLSQPAKSNEVTRIVRWESAGGVTLLYGSVAGRPRFEPALIPAASMPDARADGPALLAPPDVVGYQVKQRGRGAAEGLGIGLLAGAVAGAMVGASLGDDPTCKGDHCGGVAFSAGTTAAFGAAVGGYGGALLGTLIGALIGHTDRIVF
jgi:hypothetical protein